MRLARYEVIPGRAAVGCVRGARMVDLTSFVVTIARRFSVPPPRDPASLRSWIEAGWLQPPLIRQIDTIVDELETGLACPPLDSIKLLPPIDNPTQVFGVGRNFAAHARERGADAPESPVIFGKAVTSIIGPEDAIIIPPDAGRVDPEAEIAVVLAQGGRDIPEDVADSLIAGYTCFNDVTAREMQRRDYGKGLPWFRSKSIDTFGPMGPWLVTRDEYVHPLAVDVECRVNGEVRQRANTSSMMFTPAQVISTISRYLTLAAGDVIAMGTPEGVSLVLPGDVVEVTVQGIGTLRNPVCGRDCPG